MPFRFKWVSKLIAYSALCIMFPFCLSKFLDLIIDLLVPLQNSFDPDQVRNSVGPDLDPNCLTP